VNLLWTPHNLASLGALGAQIPTDLPRGDRLAGPCVSEALAPNTVELIPTLGAPFPRGEPVQDPVLTARVSGGGPVCPEAGSVGEGDFVFQIPTLGALFPRGGPVQDPVLTGGPVCPEAGSVGEGDFVLPDLLDRLALAHHVHLPVHHHHLTRERECV